MAAILSRPQCFNTITIQRLYNSKFPLFIPNKPFLISQFMVSWPHIYTYIFIHIHIIKYCTDARSIHVTVESTITRSSKRYCTYHCRQKINQRLKTHKRHPTPRPVWGEVCDVFCEYLAKNWPRYNGTALYCTSIYIHTHNCIRRTPMCTQRHECS